MSVTMRNVAHRVGISLKTVSQVMNVVVNCMTTEAMRVLDKYGLRIPHDIATIGSYGIPSALYSTSPLITIYQPISDLGRIDIRRLPDRINSRALPVHPIRLPTQLIIRSSCGAPVMVGPLA
ncbi:MAG: hypothetical protein BroJett011_02960 [Chloroflexota bacterium]|nr:MAG: hypothetical protein BroJett011_02960 [Chloroflexota bacterium]